MKTVKMYEIGEEVVIKAKVTNITVENGDIKYSLKTEFSNNDVGHLFTDDEIIAPLDELIDEPDDD